MMRHITTAATILLLLTGYAYILFTPSAYALHSPVVQWTRCMNGIAPDRLTRAGGWEILTGPWVGDTETPGWATFHVSNAEGRDPITKVEVFIYQNPDTGLCLFHLIQGRVTESDEDPAHGRNAPWWTMTIVEVDTQGWPKVVIFEDKETGPIYPNGIMGDVSWYFSLGMAEGPSECSYSFVVTTIDSDGTGINMPPNGLWLTLDNTPAVIVSSTPSESENIPGIGEICGHHYFSLDVKIQDTGRHLTGIQSVRIQVGTYDHTFGSRESPLLDVAHATNSWKLSDYYTDPKSIERKVQDLTGGSNTMRVTITDGVGNVITYPIGFTYTVPPRPLTISPSSGFASMNTWVQNSLTGLVQSEHIAYKEKEFGTQVTIIGNHVGDLHWGRNAQVRITMHLETYFDYHSRYGTYDVLLAVATTSNDDNEGFSATFYIPEAPMGAYIIQANSSTGYCFVDFTINPQIIYKPNEVIGPALINTEATGFPSVFDEGLPLYSLFMFCNNKDVLQGVNNQVFTNWFIDGNGTLQNRFTYDSDRYTENGLYWPIMQPGEYNVALFLDHGCQKWNKNTWVRMEHFEHTNIVTVLDTLSLLPGIDGKLTAVRGDVATILTKVGYIEGNLSYLKPIIESINRTVVTISTTVGRIEAKIDDIQPRIVDIQGKVGDIQPRVVTIQTTVGQINGTVGVISADCVQIRTTVGDIWNKIKDVNFTKITTMAQEETSQDILSSVNTSALTIPIGAVLSAVAAIAAIIAAIVVVRRLKVAS